MVKFNLAKHLNAFGNIKSDSADKRVPKGRIIEVTFTVNITVDDGDTTLADVLEQAGYTVTNTMDGSLKDVTDSADKL